MTPELIEQFGGQDQFMSVDFLVAAGASGFLLEENVRFLFRGPLPAACQAIFDDDDPGGPIDPRPVEGDPAQCNIALANAGIPKSAVLEFLSPPPADLETRLNGPEGAEQLTVEFVDAEGLPLGIIPATFPFAPPPACVGLDEGGGGPGGGEGPSPEQIAACDAAFVREGVTKDTLSTVVGDLPPELETRLAGPEGQEPMSIGFLQELNLPLFLAPSFFEVTAPECLGLEDGPTPPPLGELDPLQAAACNDELSLAGIRRDALLGRGFPLDPDLETRLAGAEGAEILTIDFLVSEDIPPPVVEELFELPPPACIGLGLPPRDEGPFGPEPLGTEPAGPVAQNTGFVGLPVEFTADEAESVTLERRWAHTHQIDEPIGFEAYTSTSGVGSGIAYDMFRDRQNSILYVIDLSSETVAAAYEYDGYGMITQTQGDLVQPYGYTGREFDQESGLYYYRARYYDASSGIFLQSDPISFASGNHSFYKYVENSPFGGTDPSGLKTVGFLGPAVAGATNLGGVTAPVFVGAIGLAAAISNALRDVNVPNLPATIPGQGATPDLPPPGDCNRRFHNGMQAQIDRLMKQPHSCNNDTQLFARMFRAHTASRIWVLRSFLNNVCFRGGNLGHRKAAQAAKRAWEKCLGY
ncbi:MAG: RHS repeat-associated core domain-containing protein [Pseudomonadota bacterium]